MSAEPNERIVLSRQLRHWRELRKLTQEELARRTGVTSESISRVERGVSGCSASTLLALAKALDVSVADLLQPERRDAEEQRILQVWARLNKADRRAFLHLMDSLTEPHH